MSANPEKKDVVDAINERELRELELEYLRALVEDYKERRKPSLFKRFAYAALGALGGGLFGIALAVIATSLNSSAPAYISALPEMFAVGGGAIGFALGERA